MNSERDATRIVRSWLEAGSNGIPDRVLDAVLSELPSTPQRRSRWSPWRSQTMNAFIKIGAVAAVVLLAVVVGSRFLPGDAKRRCAGGNQLARPFGRAQSGHRAVHVRCPTVRSPSTWMRWLTARPWVLPSQETPSPDSPGAP